MIVECDSRDLKCAIVRTSHHNVDHTHRSFLLQMTKPMFREVEVTVLFSKLRKEPSSTEFRSWVVHEIVV